MRNDRERKVRERIYIAAIGDLGEEEIDELQEFCILQIPEYIRRALPDENRYRMQTIIATDLGNYVKPEVFTNLI